MATFKLNSMGTTPHIGISPLRNLLQFNSTNLTVVIFYGDMNKIWFQGLDKEKNEPMNQSSRCGLINTCEGRDIFA